MSALKKCFTTLVAVVILVPCLDARAADVRAWLDRNSMQLGETVTLNIEASGTTSAPEPDFSALQGDFNLSGTQSSSSVNIVNGQSSSKLLWAVALEPKRAGTFTIPPLSVAGQTTQPLTLAVVAGTAATGKSGDDVYVEATVEPRAPYVQQQVAMTVKLYFAVNLVDGSLDDPQADGLIVRKVGGQDTNFAADVGGRRYRVLERRYVLQSEKSGTITIPPITFRGHAMDRADMNSFFNRGRNVTARSEPIALEIRPRPAQSGSDAWLPAQSVTLEAEGVDAHAAARVGEPLTLTLRLKATGLGFEQLPELKLPAIDGADIYPDKATTQNKDGGELTTGERERKFAIVPNRAGQLTIPPISIAWWDTTHDRAEVATVPTKILTVAPGASGQMPAVPAPPRTEVPPVAATATSESSASGLSGESLWRAISFVALALWMLTLLSWAMWAKQQRPTRTLQGASTADAPESLSTKMAFQRALRGRAWSESARALLAWARSRGAQARNLRELSDEIDDAHQQAAIDDLERVLYGNGNVPDLGDRVSSAFRSGIALRAKQRADDSQNLLPPLYASARR